MNCTISDNNLPIETRRAQKAIDRYNNNKSPLTLIVPLTIVLVLIVLLLFALGETSWPNVMFKKEWAINHSTRWLYDRHVFLIYSCAFAAWWLVYFLTKKVNDSAKEQSFKKVRTLRRLLGECSAQWASPVGMKEEDINSIEQYYREKAKSSMTTTSILIALSGLELQEVLDVLRPILKQTTENIILWDASMLGLSALFALISFIGYIISADALDVVFNRFVDDDSRHRITSYYYKSTINPRYAAFVSLISSFVLLAAYYSPIVASVGIGLFFSIGYGHWFPQILPHDDPVRNKQTKPRQYLAFITRAFIVVIFPVVPIVLHRLF